MNMTYAGTAGVRYDLMDPFKRVAQLAARRTAGNIGRIFGGTFQEHEPSRGESVYLIETPDSFLALAVEGLGTKNKVAEAMEKLTGYPYSRQYAQCGLAMIVNDMSTLGARPLATGMYLAVGDSEWFNNTDRSEELVDGWRAACDMARCTWGPGETPTLKGIIVPGTVDLAGAAIGIIKPKSRLIKGNIQHGDQIVIVESSGVHANGLTLMRRIAERKDSLWRKLGHLVDPKRFPLQALPQGYLTRLPDGQPYGEALLEPTHIYVGLVEDCLDAGVNIHYAVNITGHGWRKFMRATQPFTYVIKRLPTQLPIFDFIQKWGPVSDEEAYGNLNMGAGFALYVPSDADANTVVECAQRLGRRAFVAGYIEDGDKRVVIEPKKLVFEGDTLGVR